MTTPQDIQAALEPCLVCGHDKAFHFIEAYGPMNGLSYIKCQDCNWRTCYCDTKDVAINEWNTRVQSAAPAHDAVDMEALKEIKHDGNHYKSLHPNCNSSHYSGWMHGWNDCIDHLAPRLARSEWMPIETAPKDGTRIIAALFAPHFELSDPVIGGIPESRRTGWSFAWASRAEWCKDRNRWHDGLETLAAPNFWMPVIPPAAPQQKQGE